MSIGQRLEEDELTDISLYELYSILGDRDTPRLFDQPYVVDTAHDIPFGGANSVDRKTVYIDRTIYQQIMDNEFAATGLARQQLFERFLTHEHMEKVIIDGDNPVDGYYPAHLRALKREHEEVLNILGRDNAEEKIKKYEEIIWPALEQCYARDPKNPPKDLWCQPLLDDPEDRDEEILNILVKLGVEDARKRSKYETRYGFGGQPCESCRHWSPQIVSQEQGRIAACRIVSGLIRNDRHCDFYQPAEKTKSSLAP